MKKVRRKLIYQDVDLVANLLQFFKLSLNIFLNFNQVIIAAKSLVILHLKEPNLGNEAWLAELERTFFQHLGVQVVF